MLVVSNVSKRFPGAESYILKGVSFTTNAGERVGLIGPNGCGKSTLLKIIMGLQAPTSGSVQFTQVGVQVGYLPQGATPHPQQTIEDALFPQAKALYALEAEVEKLAYALSDGNHDDEQATNAYDAALERLIALSNQVDKALGQRMMAQLGLGGISLQAPVHQLSGGQKTRLVLAALLVQRPQLLVLDEPTNHLDIEALEWLETWLLHEFQGGVLVVSHDRAFIDRVVNRVVAIDPASAEARVHVGDYSSYIAMLQHERDKQWAQWQEQEEVIAKLRADVTRVLAKAMKKEKATQNDHQRRLAKKVARLGTTRQKRLDRYIESDERVEKPALSWGVKMQFGEVGKIRAEALRLEDLSIGYDPARPLLQHLNATLRGGERIALMGPNGQGKSTLLRTIVGDVPPLSGRIVMGGSVQVGYLAQEQETLHPQATALMCIQEVAHMTETEARAFLHLFLFSGDDPLRPLGQLSYGERTRLMLARLVAGGANLLVMDEPLNHLDLNAREQFEEALAGFPGSVLAAAHDRYFVEQFADRIWHIDGGELLVEICSAEC